MHLSIKHESLVRIWLPWIAALIVGILCATQLEAKITYYGGAAPANPSGRYYAPDGLIRPDWNRSDPDVASVPRATPSIPGRFSGQVFSRSGILIPPTVPLPESLRL